MSAVRLILLSVAALVVVGAPAAAADPTGGTPAPTELQTDAAGGVELTARRRQLLRGAIDFTGRVSAGAAHAVTIERFRRKARGWSPVATAPVAADGTFGARWRAAHVGPQRFRAIIERNAAVAAAAASPELAITVYKRATATWYGPGFYGRRTACGLRMTWALLGVAHKRLPCGTRVSLYYEGREITVPVVDRGPFRPNTTWDLTAATARALGLTHTATIGALSARA